MEYGKVIDYLRKLCSGREYCRRDMMEKALARLEQDNAAAEKAVAQLEEEGYLSESRYAAAFARDKSSIAGWGSIKIRYHLRGKGIDDKTISAALDEIDDVAANDKMLKCLTAKYKLLKEDPQSKIKLLKFALSRGYDYDSVSKAVDEVISRNH